MAIRHSGLSTQMSELNTTNPPRNPTNPTNSTISTTPADQLESFQASPNSRSRSNSPRADPGTNGITLTSYVY